MRLASKIFLAFSLVIVVLAARGRARACAPSAAWCPSTARSPRETLPALRLTTGVRDTMLAWPAWRRASSSCAIAATPTLAGERRARVATDLEPPRRCSCTPRRERPTCEAARQAFERYRAASPPSTRACWRPQPTAPCRSRLGRRARPSARDASWSAAAGHLRARRRAQAEAARLEQRTWNGVVVGAGGRASCWRCVGTGGDRAAASRARCAGCRRRPPRWRPARSASRSRSAARDEVGVLARSFNAMAARLRQLDEMKEEFFATLSHELRSPLTSVREAAHLLADGVPGPAHSRSRRGWWTSSGRSTDRLLRLVNQILDVSRLRAGHAAAASGCRVDLERAGRARGGRAAPAGRRGAGRRSSASASAREFTVHGRRGPAGAGGRQPARQRRALHAGAAAASTVRLVDAGPECEMQVEDTGVGIPAAELPHIFESYRQAHPATGGTGLGLAIVRGLVQAHGGRVTVESQEGKGSRFTVLLPAGADGVSARAPPCSSARCWPWPPAAARLAARPPRPAVARSRRPAGARGRAGRRRWPPTASSWRASRRRRRRRGRRRQPRRPLRGPAGRARRAGAAARGADAPARATWRARDSELPRAPGGRPPARPTSSASSRSTCWSGGMTRDQSEVRPAASKRPHAAARGPRNSASRIEATPASNGDSLPVKRKVLVVDDDAAILEVLEMRLVAMGFDVDGDHRSAGGRRARSRRRASTWRCSTCAWSRRTASR